MFYRCYFLVGGRISEAENIEAANDTAVLLKAEELLLRSTVSVEVWQEKRLVGCLSAPAHHTVVASA
jgi:hypothetical protein